MNEYYKLEQKEYKTWQDLLIKVIHWKLYKEFKIDHTNKS